MEVAVTLGKENDKEPKEWEIESWANTLMCAEEIKNDPEKMKLVKPYLDKKVKAIKSIAQLRAKGRAMMEDDDGDE